MAAQRDTKSGYNSLTFSSRDAKATRAAGEKVTKSALASKQAARDYLVGLGISKPNGKLAKKYGGK